MASSSNTQTNTAFSLASPTPTVQVKLDNHNYPSWLSQFMPILHSHEFTSIVDGSEPCPPKYVSNAEGKETLNPKYINWTKKDECLLSMILVTLSENVLSTMFGLNTSREAWVSLANRFASQSKSRITQLKRQLQTIRQDTKTCARYLQLAKGFVDQLAIVGNLIDDADLISFFIGGLNPSFNPLYYLIFPCYP
jgi:hypothetical protein